MKQSILIILLLILLFTAFNSFAENLPDPIIINKDTTGQILNSIVRFLLSVGMIVAVIVIVISGIKWMLAGSNSKAVESSQAMLKSGIYGAAVILAVYLIINTIKAVLDRSFFGR